ncbi:MAG: glycoside hydrolase family 127 protein [Akkermansiaceae bacterium]|jgi:hypothetical protein|nr:glycoside hydrolase family 127 protein [Akkermansiaceae bacterium]
MKPSILTLASVLAVFSVASAAPREALPFTEVKAGGELRTRIAKNFERLHAERYRIENLFTKSHDPKWPGDMEGRVTLGLVLDAQALGIDEPGIDALFAEYPRHYNNDGYFGPIHFPDHIDEQQLSSHGWVLRSLCEYWLWKQKPETKAQIQRMVETLILPTQGLHQQYPLQPGDRKQTGAASGTHVATSGKWRLSSDIGCDFIFFDGVVQAYAITRDERIVPVIGELVALFKRVDVIAIQAQTHATLSGSRAMIRWYELTGKKDVLDRAEQIFATYLKEGCTENFENYNWFGRPEWTEPCAIVDSYLVACQLWQHTGKPEYLEAAQGIYFNGISATQRSNGGFGLNNCSGAHHTHLFSSAPEAHWCCTMRGGEGLSAAARCSAFTGKDSLWLATFMDNEISATLDAGRFSFTQKSAYPFGRSTTLTINKAPESAIILQLFSPSYLTPESVTVNGAAVEMKTEAGFIPVGRVWKSGDVLEFRFAPKLGRIAPRNIHSIQGYDLIREGPLLLAARLPDQPADKKASPAALPLRGGLKAGEPGKPTLAETPLLPVYHLLDPAYDQIKGSWRQVLFPKNEP